MTKTESRNQEAPAAPKLNKSGSPQLGKRTTPHVVPLGEFAKAELERICRRHDVKPGSLLRAIVENFLSDSSDDRHIGPCAARQAEHIERTGGLPDEFWGGRES